MSRHTAPVTCMVMLLACLFSVAAAAQTTLPSERTTGRPGGDLGASAWDSWGQWGPWGPWGTNNPRCAPFWRARAPEASPYDKAAAAADRGVYPSYAQRSQPSPPPSGQESAPTATLNRPSVGERQWSTDPNSPYFRAQERAFERPGVVHNPNSGTGYDVSAFASVPDECAGVMPWMLFNPTGFGMYGGWDRSSGGWARPGRGAGRGTGWGPGPGAGRGGSTLHSPKKGGAGKR